MNRYLEKIAELSKESSFTKEALNALAARIMAKAVGIVPEVGSAWKSGLRQLRGPRGVPLQGQALSKARIGLGDLSNNGFQQVASANRKLGGGTEMGGVINRSGNLGKSTLHTGPTGEYSLEHKVGDNFHTHPGGDTIRSRLDAPESAAYMAKSPARVAAPSGLSAIGPKLTLPQKSGIRSSLDNITKVQATPGLLQKAQNRVSIDRGRSNNLFNSIINGMSPEKEQRALSIRSKLSDRMNRIAPLVSPPKPPVLSNPSTSGIGADIGSFIHSSPGSTQRIIAPSTNTVSVTKVPQQNSLSNPRTMYFDHSPRAVTQPKPMGLTGTSMAGSL